MKNGLGISFLRYINETDQSYWCQVFARLPYDEVDLSQKGALFGVVRGKLDDNWADKEVEITNWVEEYYNAVDVGGCMSDFFEKFEKEYPEIECIWIWIVKDQVSKARKLKIVKSSTGKVQLDRGGELIKISDNLNPGRVLVGDIKNQDVIRFWLDTHESDDTDSWSKIISGEKEEKSYAALNILFEVLDSDVGLEIKNSVEQNLPETKKVDVKQSGPAEFLGLASDRYVGVIGWREKIKNKFVSFRSRKISREKEVLVVGGNAGSKKRVSLIFGLLFLVALIVSIFFGNIKKNNTEWLNKWNEFSVLVEKSLQDAESIAKLNPTGAKKIVENVKNDFISKKNEFEKADYKLQVAELEKKIENSWIKVSGEKRGQVTELVNLELIRSGVQASKISYVKNSEFVVTSSESGLVLKVKVKDKDVKVVAGKGAGLGWIDAVSDGEKTYVMNKGEIFVVGNESNSLAFDSAVTKPVALSKFGSSLYVLEQGNKEIFKYQINDTGFGDRIRWLKESQVIALNPLDMDIDVDVWVLESGGQVARYRRGVKESFVLSNLPQGVEFEKISVEKDGERVALLSSSKGAVVFCKKTDGTCGEMFVADKIKEAKDIEFDSENTLMVLFSGSVGVIN